jgi:hypothetical protein
MKLDTSDVSLPVECLLLAVSATTGTVTAIVTTTIGLEDGPLLRYIPARYKPIPSLPNILDPPTCVVGPLSRHRGYQDFCQSKTLLANL